MVIKQTKNYGEGTLIPTLKGHFYTDPFGKPVGKVKPVMTGRLHANNGFC
ncbi:hypothetical protein ACFPYJ_10640 [Paenibacillus solisilvae]|uniref:Uncharacterized protein n=1 Tax=Paenibacillus solisilvae TaxID=2486751 RepID=A0ABW0VUV1_9BACL